MEPRDPCRPDCRSDSGTNAESSLSCIGATPWSNQPSYDDPLRAQQADGHLDRAMKRVCQRSINQESAALRFPDVRS